MSPFRSVTVSRESLNTSRSKTPEAINYAFSGSVDNLSSPSGSQVYERSPSISSGEVLSSSHEHDSGKGKPSRRKRSFSKSPIKTVLSKKSETDRYSESLVTDKDEDPNAFDNLAMRAKWSTFVNDAEEVTSATPSPQRQLLKEPEPVVMDRDYNMSEARSGLLTVSKENQEDFKEEYLVVDTQPQDDLDESSMSKTGFDFLDNW